ncbi:hypothetical protein ACS0TY_031372 [Phlomoides rotata]
MFMRDFLNSIWRLGWGWLFEMIKGVSYLGEPCFLKVLMEVDEGEIWGVVEVMRWAKEMGFERVLF